MTDRNDPLEIIDAMDLDDVDSAHDIGEWDSLQWQSLRTALEAQRDELAQKDATTQDKDARIARLQSAVSPLACYDANGVESVSVAVGIVRRCIDVLAEHPRHSAAALTRDSAERSEAALGEDSAKRNAAAIKAEALREYAYSGVGITGPQRKALREEADRIEHVAKEQGDE